MSKEKKDFKDTKFGQLINKAKDFAPELLNIAGSVATGNFAGVIAQTGDILKKKAATDEEAKAIYLEFKKYRMEYEKELFMLEAGDRDSARNREVEMAKTGKSDFMMIVTGLVGLGSFIFIIYAVVYIPTVLENKMFIHLLGMVEGVAMGLFAYYYGTSKSSKDKDNKLK